MRNLIDVNVKKNLALAFYYEGIMLEDALDHLETAKEQSKILRIRHGVAVCCLAKGVIYFRDKKYQEAEIEI